MIQAIQGFYSFFIISNLASFGIGAFLFSLSVTNYTKEHLNEINTNRNRLEMLKLLSDFIQLHSNFIKLSMNFIQLANI